MLVCKNPTAKAWQTNNHNVAIAMLPSYAHAKIFSAHGVHNHVLPNVYPMRGVVDVDACAGIVGLCIIQIRTAL